MVLNPRYVKKEAVGFSWTIMLQVFLERAPPIRTAENHRDSPTWGKSLRRWGWKCPPADEHITGTVHQFHLLCLFVQPTRYFTMPVFVFIIIECQLVLGQLKPWVILVVVKAMTPCFSPCWDLQALDGEGQGMWLWCWFYTSLLFFLCFFYFVP